MDFAARTRARHLENMRERATRPSFPVAAWNHFFEEPPERFNDKDIARAAQDKNILIDGAVRLLRDISKMSISPFTVDGNPYIRLGLDRSAGLIMRATHLDMEAPTLLLKSWLYDYVEFTSGDGRNRLWSHEENKYVYVGQNDRPPPATPLRKILTQ